MIQSFAFDIACRSPFTRRQIDNCVCLNRFYISAAGVIFVFCWFCWNLVGISGNWTRTTMVKLDKIVDPIPGEWLSDCGPLVWLPNCRNGYVLGVCDVLDQGERGDAEAIAGRRGGRRQQRRSWTHSAQTRCCHRHRSVSKLFLYFFKNSIFRSFVSLVFKKVS